MLGNLVHERPHGRLLEASLAACMGLSILQSLREMRNMLLTPSETQGFHPLIYLIYHSSSISLNTYYVVSVFICLSYMPIL